MSTISSLQDQLNDISTGSGDWVNVQAPVRLAIVALLTAATSNNELNPDQATTNATNIWKEITSIREDIANRATRVEVAESLRLKADRSSVNRLRANIVDKHTKIVSQQLEEQREVHFAKHDDIIRAELDSVKTRLRNLTDQFISVQFDTRLECMETKMTEYTKRRRNTSDKIAKLVATVNANSTQQAETTSLFLTGVARLREAMENMKVSIDHKADGSDVRKELALKANSSDLEALEHSISSNSLGNRFSTFENRISLLEST